MSVQRDIDAELHFHFDARIEELVAQGLSRDAARAQAIAEFGDVERTRADLREIGDRVARRRRRTDLFDALRQDVAYSLRSLRRTPTVSITIILTLGLGLGVNATMFSLLDGIYFHPPAGVSSPGEIRRVWGERRFPTGTQFWSGYDHTAFRSVAEALNGRAMVTTYLETTRVIGRGENAPKVHAAGTAANYFSTLGVKPELGRFYTAEEDDLTQASPVAVISDTFWRNRLAGDPNVLGQQLTLGSDKLTIIGVAAPGFRGIELDAEDLWMPLATALGPRATTRPPWWQNRNVNGFQVVLRLGTDSREGELVQRVTQALRQRTAGSFLDTAAVAEFGAINKARGPGKVSTEMQVAVRLAGVAIIVLLIACANIVNLLLARAVNRRREIAVRLALGISRSRLVRLLVTESILLSLVAGAAALAAANWGGALLRALLMPKIEWAESPVDWRVLAFALVASLVAGTIAGLVPALQSASPDLTSSLKASAQDGGTHRSRLRGFLVTSQAALSVVLLVGAVLFLRSLWNVRQHDFGYAVPQLAFATITYDERDSIRDEAFASRIRLLDARVAAIPGVERVAVVQFAPMGGFSTTAYFPDADTVAHHKPDGFVTAVSPSYFETIGTKLLRGQTFPAEQGGGPFTTIVNKAMADALWPNQDPIGRCIRFQAPSAPCATVIGVAQTATMLSIDEKPTPRLYVPVDNLPVSRFYQWRDLVIRADARRLPGVMGAVREMLRREFPGAIPVITTMSQVMEPEYRPWDLGAKLFTLFGVLALVVASIGVFSTVSYAVSRRMHEFGVRIALGARAADVLRQVLGDGLRVVLIGVTTGLALALAGGKLVSSLLYGIQPNDPASMAVVSAVLVMIALVAALVPAWRAAGADPVSALRAE
jgi:putative ABC transport system permease protein